MIAVWEHSANPQYQIIKNINIKIKDKLLNSILKPDTSSDSPSKKSKREWFIDVKNVIYIKINITKIKIYDKYKIILIKSIG